MYRNQKIAIVIIVVLVLTLGVIVPSFAPIDKNQSSENPRFVIASWDYPSDEYGQGIENIGLTQNSTGAWLPIGGVDSNRYYYESSEVDFPYLNASIKLRVYTWLNCTLVGAPDFTAGKNYIRHNVTIITNDGTLIFFQQNFTYISCYSYYPQVRYYHDVILNFLPVSGEIYTATITYEVYYS